MPETPEIAPPYSLRDLFAAFAMAGVVAADTYLEMTTCGRDQIAKVSYAIADAMLKHRDQPK